MKTSDFDYYLPQELIAQSPIEPRDASRMLVYNRKSEKIEHKHFYDILDYLTDNDVLVINNTRVIPARIYGHKPTGAKVEVLLLKRLQLNTYEALLKPAKKFPVGSTILFSDSLAADITANVEEIGGRVVKFNVAAGTTLEAELDKLGEMPLPPYIHKKLQDRERYQTVYNKIQGSSAAPTAGLHFTPELLNKIRAKGVEIHEVTLDVGLGTFRPVQVDDVEKHHMHSEHINVSQQVADALNNAKRAGKRIIAVGTTSVRTLESMADAGGILHAGSKDTSIFIYPGVKFKFVDGLITNFHLPQSTLIMLVSAFVGDRQKTLELYKTAVDQKYRFFSFGDSMFIE